MQFFENVNVLFADVLARVAGVAFVYWRMQAGVQKEEVRYKKGVMRTACKIFEWGHMYYTLSEVR